jgi:hypothetical protein
MTQSVKLTAFYRAYLEWVESGAGPHDIFDGAIGLCHSSWLFAGGMDNHENAKDLEEELNKQFKDAGLSVAYPFNSGKDWLYEKEGAYKHRNPKRIRWVRDHI